MPVAAGASMRFPMPVIGLAALAWTPWAHAGLQLIAEPDTMVREIRLVSARSATQTTTWLSFSAEGTGGVLVVFPLDAGARADLGSGAWLDALEIATAPRITLPASLPLPVCGNDDRVENTARPSEGALLEPSGNAVVATGKHLQSYASLAGFDPEQVSAASAASTGAFLLARYTALETAHFSRPIRVVTPGPTEPITLEGPSAEPIAVTLYSIAAARASLVERDERAADDLEITWTIRDGVSDFLEQRAAALEPEAGARACLIEHAGAGALHAGRQLPDGTHIEPVYSSYLERARTLGETALDTDGCVARIDLALESSSLVGSACAAGALGFAPAALASETPCDAADDDGVHPDALRCGGADEIAYALSGLELHPVLTRARLTLADRPLRLEFTPSSGAGVSNVLVADHADPSCPAGTAQGGGTSSYGPSATGGSSGYVVYDPYPGDYVYDTPPPDEHVEVDVVVDTSEDACSGSSEDGGDSCSGSSSDDGYDGETCSGSNSDDGYDGETCGGSSSDDGYDGETCGGDGGGESCDGGDSSGYSGDTCSGSGSGSGSGYSGDTCSGSSGSGSSCAVARRRGRPRLSALCILAASLLLPLRRVTRRRTSR